MRLSVLLAAAALGVVLSPAAALATGAQPGADPCAPVDGEVPLLCQSGPAGAPAGGPAQLPLTGGTPYAEGALVLAALGGGAVLVARRRTA